MYIRPWTMDMHTSIIPPFGSRAVARVIQIMALSPDRPFFVRELARLTGERVNGVAQALARLVRDGIASTVHVGDRPAYRIRIEYPYLPELQRIAVKSLGIPEALDAAGVTALKVAVYREVLGLLEPQFKSAFEARRPNQTGPRHLRSA